MANNLRAWSTTAASNGTADADINAAEGCPPSAVNDDIRQMMAKIKNTMLSVEYLDHGYTATYASTTTFASPGDLTAIYLAGRRLKFDCSSTLYGTIRSTSYVAANTTVTMVMDSGTTLSSSLSAVYVGILAPTNPSIPATFGKDNYTTTGGTSTAYTLTPYPGVAALDNGIHVRVKLNATCGATPTLAVSGLTAKTIVKPGNVAVSAGDLTQNSVIDLTYDSTLDKWVVHGVPVQSDAFVLYTTDQTASAGQKLLMDCSTATKTVTMPASPTAGDAGIQIKKLGVYQLSLAFGSNKLQLPTGAYTSGTHTVDAIFSGVLRFDYAGTLADGTTVVWSM
jgi:hypothetical protein